MVCRREGIASAKKNPASEEAGYRFQVSVFRFQFSGFAFRFCFSFVLDPLPSARSSTKDPAGRNACITIFLLYLPPRLEYVPRAHHT